MKKALATLILVVLCLAFVLPCAAEEPARTLATQYEFTASPDAETEIRDLIFEGDVTVSGEGQHVRFWNCEFRGNIINAAASQTFVWLMPDCTVNEGCRCILKSGIKEADMDYPIPKFASFFPIEVESEDLGGVIAVGDFDIRINDTVYKAAEAELYLKEDGSMVPYEAGMPFDVHLVIRWWENGNEIVFTACSVG